MMTISGAASATIEPIRDHQLERINALLARVLPSNRFQRARIPAPAFASLQEFTARVPLTSKSELVEDQAAHPPYGSNLTYPVEHYTRMHQTSGTTGRPLRWLDTPETWNWVLDCWTRVYESASVDRGDRICFPFSFGPFLGFWAAFDAAARLGHLAISGGGMRSPGRLRLMLDNAVTVLCSTPTYALHLAEVAAAEGIDLAASQVRLIILAGEPGGGIPATRALIESRWNGARVVDHHGMTETGPVTYECPSRPGVLHIMEAAYYPEIIDPETLVPAPPGASGELVLTNLGRDAMPLIRYRTGDLVQPSSGAPCECGSCELALEGGILARADEMFVVRGVNLYPSAVEAVLRAHGGFSEFRVEIDTSHALREMRIEVEPEPDCPDPAALARALESALASAFALRVPVHCVPAGSLPRFEVKARRWLRRT